MGSSIGPQVLTTKYRERGGDSADIKVGLKYAEAHEPTTAQKTLGT
jgi:hypothetical protein